MAHTKALGSTRNGRDSQSKRLGIKKNHGQTVNSGEIILRQRGLKYAPGINVGQGKDDTLFAIKSGVVNFKSIRKICYNGHAKVLKKVSVISN